MTAEENEESPEAWNATSLRHLLSRASFGASVAEVQALMSLTRHQVLESLFADTATPPPPGDWVSEPFDREAYRAMSAAQKEDFLMQNRQNFIDLVSGMLELMMSSVFNLREKMTAFWHNHFTSDFRTVQLAQIQYIKDDTWRRHALGNFRDFLKAMYKDPTMLVYLNGIQNIAREPNENFARELLELFTMGVGTYSEEDVKEASRAFSGWQIDTFALSSYLDHSRHDGGVKNFLGSRGDFDGDAIIDIILDQQVTANFICRKFYEAFICREVDEEFVEQLAHLFRSNDYEIKPVLRTIFESDLFYSEKTIASLIKSPLELAASNVRMLAVDQVDLVYLVYLLRSSYQLNQGMLHSPDVAGWPGQRDWITPSTFVTRNAFSETFVAGGNLDGLGADPSPVDFDAMGFARSFGLSGATELAHAMAAHLLRIPPDRETADFLLSVLLGTADPDDWSLDYPGADRRVSEFLVELVHLPEFHLT